MSATDARRRNREFPFAYRAMLRAGAPRELREAAAAACPYHRPALVAAFEAGWFSWALRPKLGEGFTAPQLSKMGRAAWLRGHQARAAHQANHP